MSPMPPPPLILSQSKTALGVGLTASFLASGGTDPYVFSVRPNGAGGSIDATSGLYTAPVIVNGGSFLAPKQMYDIIDVTDDLGVITTSSILVGTPLILFCDVIQREMGLANGRVYLWDQKIPEPSDAGLFIAVSVLTCKPFSNTNKYDGSGSSLLSIQSINMYANMQIDIISRNAEARDRKEEVIMALNSDYAQSQQENNSFYIGKLPPGSQFVNLSNPDGGAIPYRYNIAVALQYFVRKTQAVPYYNDFVQTVETIES